MQIRTIVKFKNDKNNSYVFWHSSFEEHNLFLSKNKGNIKQINVEIF